MLQRQAHPLDLVSDPEAYNWWKRPADRFFRREFAAITREHRRRVFHKFNGLLRYLTLQEIRREHRERLRAALVAEDELRTSLERMREAYVKLLFDGRTGGVQ